MALWQDPQSAGCLDRSTARTIPIEELMIGSTAIPVTSNAREIRPERRPR
jgi:hypothetical protein